MIKDYFVIAFKNLKHRGLRSWMTLIGIFIGVTSVVALISLGGALQMAIGAQFGISSTEVITVQAGGLNSYGPPGSGVTNPLTVSDSEAIEKLSTVEYAIPRNIETLRVVFNKKAAIVGAVSIIEGEKRKYIYDNLELETIEGSLLTDSDSDGVLIGYSLSLENNGFDKAMEVGNKIEIQNKTFKVKGVLKKKGSLILDGAIFMNDIPLESISGYGDEVDIIAVKVKDKSLMNKTQEDIEKLLRKRRNVDKGEEDFEVSTPEAALETVNNVLGGVQAFIVIIASISIVVGAIGIINTMTTSVLERRKEIGIMKAIGARNSQIFLQFLVESGLLGLTGGFVGVVLGILASAVGIYGINNFLGTEIKVNIDLMLMITALVGSFLIGAVSGITPALSAAKQNPVEALRG